jgi:hypothetical protein
MTWINQMEDLLLTVFRDSPARFARVAIVETVAQGLLVLELFLLLRALHVSASGWSGLRDRGVAQVLRIRIPVRSRCSSVFRKVHMRWYLAS